MKSSSSQLVVIALVVTAEAHYYGDSLASVYNEMCYCTFNCEFCRTPAVLNTAFQSRADRALCQEPPGTTPPNAGAQAWTTLTATGGAQGSGYCIAADGGRGVYMTIPASTSMTQAQCELTCAQAPACMAYEWNGQCELHADVPKSAEAATGSQAAICKAKANPPATSPLIDPPCCPELAAQLKNVRSTGFTIRVKPTPFVPNKQLLLQVTQPAIADTAVKITLQRASYVGLGDGAGGVLPMMMPPPPPAAGRRLEDGAEDAYEVDGTYGTDGVYAGPDGHGRHLGNMYHRQHTIDGASLATNGIAVRLDSRDYETFEVRVSHTAGAVQAGAAGLATVKLSCVMKPGTQMPTPPSPPASPPLPPGSVGGGGGGGGGGTIIPDDPGSNLVTDGSPYAVTVNLKVAGTVESFDEGQKRLVGSRIAEAARVDSTQVAVSVRPGSVDVNVRVPMADKDSAYAAKSNLKERMPDEESASELTGVPVEGSPKIDVEDPDEKDYYQRSVIFTVLFLIALCCIAPFCCYLGIRYERIELDDENGEKMSKKEAAARKRSVLISKVTDMVHISPARSSKADGDEGGSHGGSPPPKPPAKEPKPPAKEPKPPPKPPKGEQKSAAELEEGAGSAEDSVALPTRVSMAAPPTPRDSITGSESVKVELDKVDEGAEGRATAAEEEEEGGQKAKRKLSTTKGGKEGGTGDGKEEGESQGDGKANRVSEV